VSEGSFGWKGNTRTMNRNPAKPLLFAILVLLAAFHWSCETDTTTPPFILATKSQGIPSNLYGLVKAYHCANCHNPSGAAAIGVTMNLTSATNCYNSWVNVSAEVLDCSASATIRVVPGDAADSELWQRLDASSLCAARMPYDGPPYMSQSEVDQFKAWINNGAQSQWY